MIIIVASLSLLSTQCHKDCVSEKLGEIRFTQNELNIVPYDGTETLVFKDSINDSIIYIGTGRNSKYTFDVRHEFPDNYECPGNYYNTEINYTKFEGTNNSKILIDLYMDSPFLGNLKKYIYIRISYNNIDTWYFDGEMIFDATNVQNASPSNACVLAFNDSLIIGSNTFFNVYTLMQIILPNNLKNLQVIYYTFSNGIVGFKTEEGHLWYLAL